MGRYMRKCRGIGELAVMEVTQVVGVRTRARTMALAAAAEAAATVAEASGTKRRKVVSRTVAAAAAEIQISSYLQLRSRSIVMKVPPPAKISTVAASSRSGGLSRCSSNASVEVAAGIECRKNSSGDDEAVQDLEAVTNSLEPCTSRERRENTPSNDLQAETGEQESTAGRKSRRQPTAITPPEAEIDEFFTAAEQKEQQRFAEKYNFDVVRDAPLDGRFDWINLKP